MDMTEEEEDHQTFIALSKEWVKIDLILRDNPTKRRWQEEGKKKKNEIDIKQLALIKKHKWDVYG